MLFFFFKQKTAYEMRISDWSSDVCSSDLQHAGLVDCQRIAHEADLPGDDVALPARDLAVGLRQLLPGHLDREAWLPRGQPALVFSLGGLVLAAVVAVATEQQSAHRFLLSGRAE